ncbi:MAG: hypothetical protein DYH13_08350 [Alphaproteobacteria bacterium PRO2]|nr:hypothetical protein [Alphaproteobacteria bacterium PRO2]
MFTTYAEQIERDVSRGSISLSEDFFAAFPVIETDKQTDLAGSSSLDENGIISLLSSTLTANKMLSESLSQTFGMSSVHTLSATPAGRNAHSAIARLREARMTPPDALLRLLSSRSGTPGKPRTPAHEPAFH